MNESDVRPEPFEPGDLMEAVQISPCVGGQIRTWAADGSSRLWSVPNDGWLRAAQATGKIGRTEQEGRRFREAAMLNADRSSLVVQPRFPVQTASGYTMESQVIELAEPRRPSRGTFEDFRETLTQAVQHCVDKFEFLVVERGGWDSQREPFCLFAVLADGGGQVSVVETAPAPSGSELWQPYIDPANPSHTLSAPATSDTLAMVPTLMIDAISQWGLDPWDLAFTFGQR